MDATERLRAAHWERRQSHAYLKQPNPLINLQMSGYGTKLGEDGDILGAKIESKAPSFRSRLVPFYPSRDILIRKGGRILCNCRDSVKTKIGTAHIFKIGTTKWDDDNSVSLT
jgi:hypothetical protein